MCVLNTVFLFFLSNPLELRKKVFLKVSLNLQLHMKIIGVTGGISSGKSTASRLLGQKGGRGGGSGSGECSEGGATGVREEEIIVLDADKFGHEAYKKGSDCWVRLIDHFGPRIQDDDGEINRRELGSLVFTDKAKMRELEAIVWPEIRRLLEIRIKELREGGACKVVVVEAAIMIEAGWQDMVDFLWVVVVDRDIATERLMKRNNLSREEAEKRINAQITNEERMRHATRVITNNGDGEELERKVALAFSEETKGLT